MPAKVKPVHPPYAQMIKEAIGALKERSGSSRQAIRKYIQTTYGIDNVASHLRVALKKGVEKNTLVQTKGVGASGSFKNAVEEKKPKAKKVTKLVTKPKPKTTKPKPKTTTKSKAKPKSKTKTTKPAAKKTKKPAAKKSAQSKGKKLEAKKPAKKTAKKAGKTTPAKKAKKPAAKKTGAKAAESAK